MWTQIRDSSLFFSKNFYNNNDSNFYHNTTFINKLYYYFNNKGYTNLILGQIINILISNFIIFFVIFLLNCVDYNGLFSINDKTYIHDYINIQNFFQLNIFLWILVIIFIVFTITKIIGIIDDYLCFKYINNYYKTIDISEDEIHKLEWDAVINKISNKLDETLDIYYINNIITTKDNYLILLLEHNIIDLYHLSELMEWNIRYCIFFNILDKNLKINKSLIDNKYDVIKSIKYQMKVISIINFIFMPFLAIFILFYNFFNYGEEFYSKPDLIISRIFSKNEKWKLRYYNELEHEFNKRISHAEKYCQKYSQCFSNKLYNLISRLLVFVFSSVFIVLVILTFINDKILINLLIFKNHSMLWFIGLLASLITILKKQNEDNNSKKYMTELSKIINIDKTWIDDANKNNVKKQFFKMYQYKIFILLKDIVYTIITPFKLWILSYNIENVINFIIDNTKYHEDLKYICTSSYIDTEIYKQSTLNREPYNNHIDNTINNTINNDIHEDKKIISLAHFKEKYPSWCNYMEKKILNNNSIKINII
jgi:autophagy-related protein 9